MDLFTTRIEQGTRLNPDLTSMKSGGVLKNFLAEKPQANNHKLFENLAHAIKTGSDKLNGSAVQTFKENVKILRDQHQLTSTQMTVLQSMVDTAFKQQNPQK